jgi:hypothetical protein
MPNFGGGDMTVADFFLSLELKAENMPFFWGMGNSVRNWYSRLAKVSALLNAGRGGSIGRKTKNSI